VGTGVHISLTKEHVWFSLVRKKNRYWKLVRRTLKEVLQRNGFVRDIVRLGCGLVGTGLKRTMVKSRNSSWDSFSYQ